MSDAVSGTVLRDILAGCEGVTAKADYQYLAQVPLNEYDSPRWNADAAHWSRLDPQTIASIVSELIARREADVWQPIETAPKDGTAIDLWGTRNGEPRRFVRAFWGPIHSWGTGDVIEGHDRWHSSDFDLYGEYDFTHWRPINLPLSTNEPKP